MKIVPSHASAGTPTRLARMRFLALAATSALLIAACGNDDGNPAAGPIEIRTLSSSPDRVTGGDALMEVRYPDNITADNVRVTLNGTDVTAQFTTRDATAHTMRGLVTGLTTDATSTNGSRNSLVAINTSTSATTRSEMILTNYPLAGPVLSGPHIAPYECRTVDNGLGAALDADCTATTQVTYYYRSTDKTFKSLPNPTGARPSDLATTTTNAGVTVPYIVRVESGTINRGVYRLAVLDDPVAGATKYVPTAGWNRKLIVFFDCCGSAQYNQGVHSIGTILSDRELSRGFAFMNSTELWNNQHANPHLQGETLMMMKEYFIERVGVPKWTIGVGGSGGAIQQYLVAQLFPGLLDGIQPNVSFPETLMPEIMECRLLNNVYASNATRWTTAKQTAINGFNNGTCQLWDLAFSSIIKSDNAAGCGVTQPANVANIYNKATNPNGLRCDFFQTNVNLLGVTPGTNKARRPIDNVGIQYGLAAMNRGAITVQDFLDVNAAVGGFDNDGIPQTARTVADPEALRLTYEGGFKNSFSGPGLANIPIITQRANADEVGDIHDPLQDLIIRARLLRANGRTDNQIIFASGLTSGFDIGVPSLDTLNTWLDAIVADPAPASIDKVARLKPATATDACWDPSGVRINETASLDPSTRCNTIYPRFSTPHLVAGGPLTNDIMKCQLKPVTMSDYTVAFTSAQLAQLNAIFATGVCDWSKAGVNQNPLRGTYLKLPLS